MLTNLILLCIMEHLSQSERTMIKSQRTYLRNYYATKEQVVRIFTHIKPVEGDQRFYIIFSIETGKGVLLGKWYWNIKERIPIEFGDY